MSLRPRAHDAPRPIKACWAIATLAGLALVSLGPHPTHEPRTLSPASLSSYLRRAAGPNAHDIRVNGFYGSGHHGGWQFTAHLTWRTPDGQIAGGVTTLPELASATAWTSTVDTNRLATEQRIGWTLADLDRILDELPATDDPLAMLNLDIIAGQPVEVVYCHSNPGATASCEARDRERSRRTFRDALLDEPLLAPLSVQRTSAPVLG